MTKLHFNYKDIFRALRLGFSAKKIWLAFVGLLCGLAGYSALTYLAHLTAGSDFARIWTEYRLLPFADPLLFPFPWYAWLVYAVGVAFFVSCVLLAGTAVSKVTYEQLKGDEFYESREAFRFAFKHWASVLVSPLLLVGFIAVLVALGLLTSLVGWIPHFGELWLGILAIPSFLAAMFIVYLLLALLTSLLIGPSVVGSTRNDTFDTVFEVFSCLNEQPARLPLYVLTVAVLSRIGCGLLAVASSFAGRISHAVLRVLPGAKVDEALINAADHFTITLPDWLPESIRSMCYAFSEFLGLPEIFATGGQIPVNWSGDILSILIALAMYAVALIVIAFGCSIWYSGLTLSFVVLVQKKDDKNLLEIPEEDELLAPVVEVPGREPGADSLGEGQQ
ncbi:MAG: hypothetical protein R6X14_08370 [bacterium]